MEKHVTCTWKNKIIFGGCNEILIKIKSLNGKEFSYFS